MSYDIRDYAKLGHPLQMLQVENPEKPSDQVIRNVQDELVGAIANARRGRSIFAIDSNRREPSR